MKDYYLPGIKFSTTKQEAISFELKFASGIKNSNVLDTMSENHRQKWHGVWHGLYTKDYNCHFENKRKWNNITKTTC